MLNVPENITLTITEDARYYYKIMYTDIYENKDVEGYVAKKVIRLENVNNKGDILWKC